ncbi:MAG: RNA polymerase sigma factor [Brumimicrobium sp.]|nr:RNA polymerase sigma factor [Brumimicrobium sp.]
MDKNEYHIAVEEYSDRLYRFALKLCKDRMIADDFVQDTFEKVWIKKDEISFDKIKSYLFRTLYNKFVDYTRKTKILSIDDYSVQSSYQEPNPDLNEILHEALNKLSEIQRSAVLLRDYEGYNYNEIGEILGLTEAQVKVYIFRARKHLQQYIGKLEAVI